jgi:hypothetical protein
MELVKTVKMGGSLLLSSVAPPRQPGERKPMPLGAARAAATWLSPADR